MKVKLELGLSDGTTIDSEPFDLTVQLPPESPKKLWVYQVVQFYYKDSDREYSFISSPVVSDTRLGPFNNKDPKINAQYMWQYLVTGSTQGLVEGETSFLAVNGSYKDNEAQTELTWVTQLRADVKSGIKGWYLYNNIPKDSGESERGITTLYGGAGSASSMTSGVQICTITEKEITL